MASIYSLMGSTSSSSSIYGSRGSNIISGLASGLDTESMIEGMLQSYKQKIQGLQQDRTKLQWQQSAYQSISNKLVELSRKYTSYTSTTNLFSNSFFDNAVTTTAKGTYSDLVSATGKGTSDVVINGVSQLASKAQYSVSNSLGTNISGTTATVTGGELNLSNDMTLSTIDGSLSIKYGSQTINLNFGELDLFQDGNGKLDTSKLQETINKQLDETEIVVGGTTYKASERVGVTVGSNGEVSLNEIGGAGNALYISGASGNFASLVKDLEDAVKDESSSFSLDMTKDVSKTVSTSDYLSDKTISVTLNGQTKTIKLGGITPQGSESFNDAFVRTLNEKVADAFGNGKLTAKLDGGKLTFTGNASDNFSISSGAGELVGLGSETLTSYLDTNKTLGDLLGDNMGGLKEVGQDDNGNDLYGLTINGVTMKFTKDTSLSSVMEAINSNTEAGVDVSYSKLTNEFVFTAKETGSAGKIEMGDDLAKQLFGDSSGYTQGTDAVFTATINGKTQTFTRSTNNVDLDGLKVTLEGTFDAVYVKDDQGQNTDVVDKTQGVSFSTKTNTDTIVDAIKQFVEDYNALVTEVKKAYSDMPLQQSNGSRYEPLTSEQEADMTESELKAYEEKAKTGILFMDSDLSSLYNSLRSAVTPGGNDGAYLRFIGINTSYSEGLTTISLDEAALREALETDPDGVRDAFAKSQKNGAATDGLMASIQSVTEKYAATTGATKGILIEKAGSQYAPSSALQNTMLDKMDEIDEQIEKWQDKMTNKVDYYTNKFTQLEMLINQMNSQSSALAGLTGGY
ncbi:flagellar filament capping protein FliD [Intestinimonas butyriciproducens]|uniref:flagellar filament capping protein FliD n=1 Tax=Intestinimonas butyriciproducens TaxID=1297617 RepID=UPI00195DF534|nr:flagellar filament capping protein FliD [Intestinimonas butyriciproducens]MBM6976147.1 flagellar filament capping protein FliD [Intestinimonas butyriciproducens]